MNKKTGMDYQKKFLPSIEGTEVDEIDEQVKEHIHTEERTVYVFECPECPKKFEAIDKEKLIRDASIHAMIKHSISRLFKKRR